MPQHTPYLEIAITIMVLAFLAFVVVGGFNQPSEDLAQATARPE